MRRIIHRIQAGERCLPAEIGLRAAGLAMLGAAAAATFWLYRAVHRPPPHDAGAGELLAATIIVLGWCSGWPLLWEGPGLFRLVSLPQRWGSIDIGRDGQ